ncbi:hypothetical protein D020_3842A, partial [Vibrio parahaemolyticus SBR10290]
MAALEVVLPT